MTGIRVLLYSLLVAICYFVSNASAAKQILGLKHHYNYVVISNRLTRNVQKVDPTSNLEAATEWLANERKNPTPSEDQTKLIEALELFTSMKEALEPSSCNSRGLDILSNNDDATVNQTRDLGNKPMRVSLVVNAVCKQHGEMCHNVYKENCKTTLSQMDQTALKRVETFMDSIINDYILKEAEPGKSKSAVLYEKAIRKEFDFGYIGDHVVVFKALEKSVMSDADPEADQAKQSFEEKIFIEREFRAIFDKYLVEPCNVYLAPLSKDIFKPASFDSLYIDEAKDHSEEYYFAWTRYKLCRRFIWLSDYQDHLIPETRRYANRQR